MKSSILLVSVILLAGCTSIDVRPVASTAALREVCVVHNEEVLVEDFEKVLRDGLDRHGIASSVVTKEAAKDCETTLTYSAARGWDLVPFLNEAELRLWRGGRQIGAADYRHKGGFALTKFAGTKAKLDPVIDKLLGAGQE